MSFGKQKLYARRFWYFLIEQYANPTGNGWPLVLISALKDKLLLTIESAGILILTTSEG